MNTDWKDILGSLKESGAVPEDNSPDPDPTHEETADHSLKSKLRVIVDKKGRKGKTATIIEGFEGSDSKLQELAKLLKQRLGSGGSARDGEILIQGDRKNDVISILSSLGYKVK